MEIRPIPKCADPKKYVVESRMDRMGGFEKGLVEMTFYQAKARYDECVEAALRPGAKSSRHAIRMRCVDDGRIVEFMDLNARRRELRDFGEETSRVV